MNTIIYNDSNRSKLNLFLFNVILLILLHVPIYGDEQSDNKKLITPIHVGIYPPICTNGNESRLFTHYLSLNAILGSSKNIYGYGFGLIGYKTNGKLYGWQNSLIFNRNKGPIIGIQSAGILNYSKGPLLGVQNSLCNIASNKLVGIQIGGIFNYLKNDGVGIQTGLCNIARSDFLGLQTSALFNTTKGTLTGSQISPITNRANDINGFQLSLFYNRANIVKGSQIGLVNVSRRMYGIPIGLINIFTDGFLKSGLILEHDGTLNFYARHGIGVFFYQINYGYVIKPENVHFEKLVKVGTNKQEFLSTSLGLYDIKGYLTYGVGASYPIAPKLNFSAAVSFGYYMANASWHDEDWDNGMLFSTFDEEWNGFIDYVSIEHISLSYRLNKNVNLISGIIHKMFWETCTEPNQPSIYTANNKFTVNLGIEANLFN